MPTINQTIAKVSTLQHKGRMLSAQAAQCEHEAEFLIQCVEEARTLGVGPNQDISAYMAARKKAEAQALAQRLTPEVEVVENPTRAFTEDETRTLCDKVRAEFEAKENGVHVGRSRTLELLCDSDSPGKSSTHINKQGVLEYSYERVRALPTPVYRRVRKELGKAAMVGGFSGCTDLQGLVTTLCEVSRDETTRAAILS